MPKVTFQVEYQLGDIVYFKTDKDHEPWMVTSFAYSGTEVFYTCERPGTMVQSRAVEISKTPNYSSHYN